MILGENICLSGGAEGADLQFGMTAGSLGHTVIHFSYAGHRTRAPEVEVVRLTEEQLLAADPHLAKANETLKRRWPIAGKPWIANLLRRNYYQVADSERLYAVSKIERGIVAGGTAWAVQMFIDIHGGDETYVFDQVQNEWFQYDGTGFSLMFKPPVQPHGIYTGIGSRELETNGKEAIRSLMNWTKPELTAG